MWKFKSWKGKDKALFLLSLGAILCILALPAEKLTGKAADGASQASASAQQRGDGVLDSTLHGSGDGGVDSDVAGGDADSQTVSAAAQTTYEAILERRVKEVLKHVEGVGNVDVLIVLKSSAEKVIQTDDSRTRSVTEEKDSSGGTRKTENEEQENVAVFTGTDSGRTPVVQKELYPEISGIVISAEGGGNPSVSAEISAAMEALFGLPAHKIKVLKRVE